MKKLQLCMALFCMFGMTTIVFAGKDKKKRTAKQELKDNRNIVFRNAAAGMVASVTTRGQDVYSKENTSKNLRRFNGKDDQ